MKKGMVLLLLFLFSQSFSLTLEQVKTELKKASVPWDSIEINFRTTVRTKEVYQQTDIYIVNKGKGKSYTEIKNDFLKQRSIVNCNKMKVVDLKTNKSQIMDYHGEALKSLDFADFNPLDSGEWSEPKLVSNELYAIEGGNGILYYNGRLKRIEKLEAEKGLANTLTTFTYDADNNLKKMVVSVVVNGVESIVTTEILRMQKSDKISDKLFDY